MIITESSWVAPLGYQSEGPFLMAAYQSLTGVDTFYWFSDGSPEYQTDLNFPFATVAGEHPLVTKWSANVPPIMGEFPACALLYRQGYLKQGAPVIHEERPLADLWERKAPLIAEDGSLRPQPARHGGQAVQHPQRRGPLRLPGRPGGSEVRRRPGQHEGGRPDALH